MAVQKSKRSKARTHHKRSAWAQMDSINAMECPNCGEAKLPHRVCPQCNHYDGREVGSKKTATEN